MKRLLITLLITPTAAIAATTNTIGDWLLGTFDDNSGYYASTVNDSSAVFGEACFTAEKTCQWRMVIDTSCEKDHKYPVLANTDQGSANLEVICDGKRENGSYAYIFTSWKNLEGLLKKSKLVGFATAIGEARFVVYRFNLRGMNESTDKLEQAFYSSMRNDKPSAPKSSVTGTRTERL